MLIHDSLYLPETDGMPVLPQLTCHPIHSIGAATLLKHLHHPVGIGLIPVTPLLPFPKPGIITAA